MDRGTASRGTDLRRGAAFALAYLLLAFVLLPRYGPTYDISIGEIPHGERYLDYLLSADARHLDFALRIDDASPSPPHPIHDPERATSAMVWAESCPLAGILSAISCRLFFETLGVAPPMWAHLVVAPAFAALLLIATYLVAARFFGSIAACGAVLACFLSPRFFDDALHNIKDLPEAALYTLAAIGYVFALARGGWRAWALAGIAHGLALAQKPNALFLFPQIAATWLVLARARHARPWRESLRGCLVAGVALLAAFLLASPMYWEHPILFGGYRLAFLLQAGTEKGVWKPFEALRAVLFTTPPVLLLLAAIGAARRDVPVAYRLVIALGALVPIGRTMLPGMVNFDGVRHFWEFWPPLALLAGLGFAAITKAARARLPALPERGVVAACTVLVFAAPAAAVIQTHPHGIAYFNAFVGGLKGAQARGEPQATDYWAGSYWQGLDWFAKHAEPEATLAVPLAEHVARFAAPLRGIGPDRFADPYEPPRDRPFYVMFVTLSEVYDDTLRWLTAHRTPAHSIVVQGAPILNIYRLDDPADIERVHRGWSESRAIQRSLRWIDHQRIRLLQGADEATLPSVLEQFPEHVRRDMEIAARVFQRRKR